LSIDIVGECKRLHVQSPLTASFVRDLGQSLIIGTW
jgi:hypothetical protein